MQIFINQYTDISMFFKDKKYIIYSNSLELGPKLCKTSIQQCLLLRKIRTKKIAEKL